MAVHYNCTLFTAIIPFNFSITFSTHVVTSDIKLKTELLTGNTKTYTTVK